MTEITFESFISDVSYGLKSNNGNQKFCFVLGAGASIKSGIASGEMMVQSWEKDLCKWNPSVHAEWKTKHGITKNNQAEHYSDYYERCCSFNLVRVKGELIKCIENGKPSIGYHALAYILTHGSSNLVITTNFDHLTEDAITQAEKTFPRVVGHEALADYIDLKENRPTIIKLHRDILFDPKNTNIQTKKLENSIKRKLPRILSEYQLIFIGYAGNDKSLMDYLSEPGSVEKFRTRVWKRPYWTIYEQNPNAKQEAFLEKADGVFIRRCSFDDIMIALGHEIGWRLPPKTDYLEKIQKRAEETYDFIQKQFQEYTQISMNPSSDMPKIQKQDLNDCNSTMLTTESPIARNSALEITRGAQTDSAEKQYRKAVIEYDHNNFDKTIEILEKLIKSNPNNPRFFNGLSSAYHAKRQFQDAIEYGRKAVECAPGERYYHEQLAIIYYDNRDYESWNKEIQIIKKLR